ncbi:hypothetical protein [Streptomyces sp. enrichment culture]|uniref:hypothetical protein n=1 Tax=Streptomyces sp. enrichment culture TaxID=1795815 RepID=UPI003F542F29
MPVLLSCNPEDAILGGGDDDLRTIGLKWAAGLLDGSTTYGDDSRVAQQVAMSDITAAQRQSIQRLWMRGELEGDLEPYFIGSKDTAGKIKQFLADQWSIATGDHNTATAVLGSYTARYKILRANTTGIQARITIENNMTMSSFAHIATGYGTAADRMVQRYDHDGIVASRPFTSGSAMQSHFMTITFRVMIPM